MSDASDFSSTCLSETHFIETVSEVAHKSELKLEQLMGERQDELPAPVNRHWQPALRKPLSIKVIRENERVKEALLNYVLY